MDVKQIQLIGDKWVLVTHEGTKENYLQITVLINNLFFSLIQLTNVHQKKLIILFHDQLNPNQLRLLHFKAQNRHIDV